MDWSPTIKITIITGSRLVKTIGLFVGRTGKKVGEDRLQDGLDGGPSGH